MTDELYSTTDMELATVLSINFPIKEMVNNGGRGSFVFENSDELQDFIDNYWNKRLTVEPSSLFIALKYIKNRIHNELRK